MKKLDFGKLKREYPYPEAFKTSDVEKKVDCPFVEECLDCAEPTNFPKCDKYLSKVGYISQPTEVATI